MDYGLTFAGWIFVISAWTFVIGMTVYCFWRVLLSQRTISDE